MTIERNLCEHVLLVECVLIDEVFSLQYNNDECSKLSLFGRRHMAGDWVLESDVAFRTALNLYRDAHHTTSLHQLTVDSATALHLI